MNNSQNYSLLCGPKLIITPNCAVGRFVGSGAVSGSCFEVVGKKNGLNRLLETPQACASKRLLEKKNAFFWPVEKTG